MLNQARTTRFLERICSVCYCMWVWFMQGLKGSKGFLALLNGCYFPPLNNRNEKKVALFWKRKWFSFSCHGASVALWKPVQFPFTFNSIDHLGDICIYFTTSYIGPCGLFESLPTWVPWSEDATFPFVWAKQTAECQTWWQTWSFSSFISGDGDGTGDKILTWYQPHVL